MLPSKWRIQVANGAAVSVTVSVHAVMWRVGTSGALEFSTKQTLLSGAAVGSAGVATSGPQDNGSAGWMGVHLYITATPASAATGTVTLLMQMSTDSGASEWPSNGRGTAIKSLAFKASSAAMSDDAEY